MTTSALLGWIIVWTAAAIGTVALRGMSARKETGLVWAYLANLWLLHWPAAVAYTLPGTRQSNSRQPIQASSRARSAW
jgi:hypothetical protein